MASKKSGPTPIAAAASEGVRANLGTDTASFLATLTHLDPIRANAVSRLQDDPEELDMAVVAAQIHLEVQVRTLIEHAAEADGPAWVDVLMNTKGLGNLNNKQIQALIRALLGLEITKAPEWKAYQRHNVLRNAIVHEGQDVELEEAAAAVEAIRDLCIRLATAAMTKGLSSA